MYFGRKNLSDTVSKEILIDTVDFKLVLAKHVLERIPNQISSDFDWNHFVLESNVESFLFYSNLAIESLAMKIDETYNLQVLSTYNTKIISENQNHLWDQTEINREQLREGLTIFKVRNLLNPAIADHARIQDIITRYFGDPQLTSNGWDLSRSSLWQLRKLRNHVAHSQIMNRRIIAGNPRNRVLYLFRFTIEDYQSPDPSRNRPERIGENLAITIDRPYDYFENLFDNLLNFIDEIRAIIQYSHMSSQHKNQLNFELKS